MNWLKPLSRCTVLAGILAASSLSSNADLIPVLDSVSLSGGSYLYTYHVNMSKNTEVNNAVGNPYFVTLLDFYGYVGGSATVLTSATGNTADWQVQTQLLGQVGYSQNPPDNAGVINVEFKYFGASTIIGPYDLPTNPPPVLSFSLRSTNVQTATAQGIYSSNTEAVSPPNTVQGNSGQYLGPSSRTRTDVPEPGTMAWMICFGVTGSTFAWRRRRKSA